MLLGPLPTTPYNVFGTPLHNQVNSTQASPSQMNIQQTPSPSPYVLPNKIGSLSRYQSATNSSNVIPPVSPLKRTGLQPTEAVESRVGGYSPTLNLENNNTATNPNNSQPRTPSLTSQTMHISSQLSQLQGNTAKTPDSARLLRTLTFASSPAQKPKPLQELYLVCVHKL